MVEFAIEWNMETQKSIHANAIGQLLLMVSAVCLLGFTGCNSLDAPAGKGFHNRYIGQPDGWLDEDVVAANRELIPR